MRRMEVPSEDNLRNLEVASPSVDFVRDLGLADATASGSEPSPPTPSSSLSKADSSYGKLLHRNTKQCKGNNKTSVGQKIKNRLIASVIQDIDLLSMLQNCFKINALIFERLKATLGFHTPACVIKNNNVVTSRQDINFVGD